MAENGARSDDVRISVDNVELSVMLPKPSSSKSNAPSPSKSKGKRRDEEQSEVISIPVYRKHKPAANNLSGDTAASSSSSSVAKSLGGVKLLTKKWSSKKDSLKSAGTESSYKSRESHMPSLDENDEDDEGGFFYDYPGRANTKEAPPGMAGPHHQRRLSARDSQDAPGTKRQPRKAYIDRVYDAVCRRVLRHMQTQLETGRPALELFLLHRDRTLDKLHWFTLNYTSSTILEKEYNMFIAYEHIFPGLLFVGILMLAIAVTLLVGSLFWRSYRSVSYAWDLIVIGLVVLLFDGLFCLLLATVRGKELLLWYLDIERNPKRLLWITMVQILLLVAPCVMMFQHFFFMIGNTGSVQNASITSVSVILVCLVLLCTAVVRQQSWIAATACGWTVFISCIVAMRIAVDDQYNADLGYKAVLMSLCEALLMFYLYRREMHERLRFQTLWNSAMDVATNNALLHNLLPAPICRRVQAGETVLDERDNIPVLFAQVANYSDLVSECSSPQQLFRILHDLYTEMDDVTRSFEAAGVFKVEHVGKDYVCASSVVLENPNEGLSRLKKRWSANSKKREVEEDARAIVLLGHALLDAVSARHKRIKLKVGIAIGPLVAGVIGTNRQFFRLFGDTVNTAARMCHYSIPGRVHITHAMEKVIARTTLPSLMETPPKPAPKRLRVRRLSRSSGDIEGLASPVAKAKTPNVAGKFVCTSRGAISIKGKGTMETFFVEVQDIRTAAKNLIREGRHKAVFDANLVAHLEESLNTASVESTEEDEEDAIVYARHSSFNVFANHRNIAKLRTHERHVSTIETSGAFFESTELRLRKNVIGASTGSMTYSSSDNKQSSSKRKLVRSGGFPLSFDKSSSDLRSSAVMFRSGGGEERATDISTWTGSFCNAYLEHRYLLDDAMRRRTPVLLLLAPPTFVLVNMVSSVVLYESGKVAEMTNKTMNRTEMTSEVHSSVMLFLCFLVFTMYPVAAWILNSKFAPRKSFCIQMLIGRRSIIGGPGRTPLFIYQCFVLAVYAIAIFFPANFPADEYAFVFLQLFLIFAAASGPRSKSFLVASQLFVSWVLAYAMSKFRFFEKASACANGELMFPTYERDEQVFPVSLCLVGIFFSFIAAQWIVFSKERERRLMWYLSRVLGHQESICNRYLRNMLPKVIVERLKRATRIATLKRNGSNLSTGSAKSHSMTPRGSPKRGRQRKLSMSLRRSGSFTTNSDEDGSISISSNVSSRAATPVSVDRVKLSTAGSTIFLSGDNADAGETLECVCLCSDLCDFTKLSASMSHTRLVQVLKQTFSIFDDLVDARGLYKMDTVGDAFVALGVVPLKEALRNGESLTQARERVVRNVVELAVEMQDAIVGLRRDTGLPLSQRIGVHIGPVYCGCIGKMQTRFHVVGKTLLMAEELEKQGRKDSVLVSSEVSNLMDAGMHSNYRLQPETLKSNSPFATALGSRGYLVSNVRPVWFRSRSLVRYASSMNE